MKPKVLIVENDQAIQTQLKYGLRDDYRLTFAQDRTRTVACVAEIHPVLSLDRGVDPPMKTR